ncbi:MAG: ATP-binding protein [Halobacteriales archaeon]
MTLVETLLAAGLDAAAVALLGAATWVAIQSRERPSAVPFVGVVGLLTVWAVAQFMSELPLTSSETLLSSGTLLSSAASLGAFVSALTVPGAWTVYALGYTGRGIGLTRRRIIVLFGIVFPIVAGIAVVIGGVVTTGEIPEILLPILASLVGFEILYLFGLFLYATYLMIGLARRNARVSNLQITMVLCGVAAPYVVGLVGADGSAVTDGVTVGLLLSGGLLGAAMWQYPVLTGFPKADYVARTRVVERLQEAVFVIDWEETVLDANATAAQLFDRSTTDVVGDPIESIVEGLEGTDLSAGVTGTVTLGTTEGRRRFQYSVSAVSGTDPGREDAEAVARAVLFRDVTDQQMREQRLTVLNRVLRHNVRNELDVVLARADRIDDEELREGIRESATDLVELGNKAREVEEVMTASMGPPEPVDLAAVAERVVEEYRGESAGEITVEAPEELVVSSHRTVLEAVLSELLDNAIAHAGTSPSVEVRVRRGEEGTAELVVGDDGPGIPERERQILAEGSETQLRHGRGLGLWFVNWAVTRLGGELEFSENDPEGSVVTIRLYGAEYG